MNGTLRPGRITEVLENGNVRVDAPGLFARADGEANPPIMPFFGWHANTYTEPQVHQEVWVMNFSDNPLQLFWFRKDSDRLKHNADLEQETNVEILCNRETPGGYASIYFSDGTGWVIAAGDNSLTITPDGDMTLKSDSIVCDCDMMKLGSEDSNKNIALAEDVEDVCHVIKAGMEQLSLTCSSLVLLAPLKGIFENMATNISEILASGIGSQKIFADK